MFHFLDVDREIISGRILFWIKFVVHEPFIFLFQIGGRVYAQMFSIFRIEKHG